MSHKTWYTRKMLENFPIKRQELGFCLFVNFKNVLNSYFIFYFSKWDKYDPITKSCRNNQINS